LFYKQAGVGIEGIRPVLLMNPRIEFTEESQILDDLRPILPSTPFTPFNSYDLAPVLSYRYLKARSTGDHHNYELIADVKNVGSERVTDFKLRVLFPRAFLNPSTTWAAEERQKSTNSHICFAANSERAPDGLYPSDTLTYPLSVEYFVDSAVYDNPQAMQSEIFVELFSGSMKPKKQTFPIKDFQQF
jgi:hypothetical protein